MSASAILLPGQPLPASVLQPPAPACGSGCHLYNGQIISSIVGRARRTGAVVSVIGREETAVPEIDAIVMGTITRVTPQQAHLVLSTVNSRPLPESTEDFTGIVRISDIRLTERDKLKMGECFRLGDIVKAKVLSLGDARSYYLSTAANELGVVHALSEQGNPMLPVSYQDMEDTITGKTERRKVAKPETA